MNWSHWSLPDWASVLSLLIVIYNAATVTRIKRDIIVNLTLEPLLQNLRRDSVKLNSCLLLYSASRSEFDGAIEVCAANLRALRRRLGVRQGQFCTSTLRSIKAYRRRANPDAAQQVYNHLQGVIQEVANRADELRISGP